MEGKDILFRIVDLALAFIGFSSLVTALRRSKEEAWHPQEINGLVFLAMMGIGAILFALLPFSLFYMELRESLVYSISSALYVVFSVCVILGLTLRGRKSGFPSRRPKLFKAFAVLSIVVISMMGLVAAGVISKGVLGFYLFGVMWLLVMAFVQFVVFLSFVGFLPGETSATLLTGEAAER